MGWQSFIEAHWDRIEYGVGVARQLSLATLAASLSLASASAADVTTYHDNPQRTGWNASEQTLTPTDVATPEFRLKMAVTLDDQVDTQPLIVNKQTIKNQGQHDVVYVATENNTIYAIDGISGDVLLSANFGAPVPVSALPGNCNNNTSHVGINGTPVIDTAAGVMYVIIYTFENSTPIYRIHALSLQDLTDKTAPVQVTATERLSDGTTYTFRPHNARQRSALLEANGNIYAAFASFCDIEANLSRGWVLGWHAGSLTPLAAHELTNKQSSRQGNFFLSSIWMSGYGVAADAAGDVYFVTGNSGGNRTDNIQESAVRMSTDLATVKDFFTPSDFGSLDGADTDFASGGLLVLPDQPGRVPHLAVAAGKDGRMFIINRDSMGGFVSGGPDKPMNVPIGNCWCGPAYYTGSDGVGRVVSSGGTQVNIWKVDTALPVALTLEGSSASLTNDSQDGGFFTAISSNGTQANSAVIWAVSRPSSQSSNPGGFKTQSDVFVADDGFMYFRGTDNKVWRVSTDGSIRSNPGGFTTQSNVFAAGGFMYFRGTDDKVWRVSTDGTTVRSNPGGFATHSDVILGSDGMMYFRGTDDKVWRVSTDGTTVRSNPGGFATHSDVIPGSDGMMYFRGTDDKVWRVSTDGTTVRSNPGGFSTHSDVRLGADGMMYFRGTDDKVWRVSTDGTSVRSNPGGFTTQSDIILGGDGMMYFRGTDDKVWRVSTDGKTSSNIGGFKTQSDVFFLAHGYVRTLFSGIAGTWPSTGGNANIVPVVANGEVFVASFRQLSIFGLAPAGRMMTRVRVPERPLEANAAPPPPAVSGSRYFGTIASVEGDKATVRLSTGKTVIVDLAGAREAFQTVVPFVGETVVVTGTLAANGTLTAQTMLRAKGSSSWGPNSQ
jgi:hypothetical protein